VDSVFLIFLPKWEGAGGLPQFENRGDSLSFNPVMIPELWINVIGHSLVHTGLLIHILYNCFEFICEL